MNKHRKPKGSISILFSILLLILFGFAALAVDIGYMAVAKSELQSAADSGARAGAVRLYDKGIGPDWNTAKQRAEELAEMNPTTGNLVSLLSPPEAGYWNAKTGGQDIQSPTGFTPTAYDFPAVKVTASRTGVGDGGPIATLFARTLKTESGWVTSAPMTASAIAVVSGPGYVDQRHLFPFVMSQCMYDTYWNASATPPGPVLENGEPKQFTLGSHLSDPFCQKNTGTWTSLKVSSTNSNYIRDIIDGFGTNASFLQPDPISIGDIIVVASGAMASNYLATTTCINTSDRCSTVTIAVVTNAESGNAPRDTDVLAFACLKLISANQGQKTIKVQMTTTCDPPGSGGIGPDYGFKPRPRIVQ